MIKMIYRIRQLVLWSFTLFLGLSISSSYAQELNTRISGEILDKNKAAVIGANVTIRNASTGFFTGSVTDLNGEYDIREIPLGGPYTIEVTYVGYQTIKQSGVNISLGDRFKYDFEMSEGTDLQEVVVSANSLKNRTERFGNAVAITGKTIATIPTPTRNFEQLGVLSPQSYVPDVGQRNFGGAPQAGAKGGQTGYSVDGTNSRRMVFGGSLDGPAFTISQEAIREFEIQTNEYSVLNGRNLGGSIKAVTKSGTNEFHGSAWYYRGGGEGFLTQSRSATGSDLSSIPSQNQFGLSVSGPIIKDKLFFFAVYDDFRTNPVTSPFSLGFIDFENSAFANTAEAEAFYGMTQTEVQNILDVGSGLGYNSGSIGNLEREVLTRNIFVRTDYNINEKHKASLRYSFLDYFQTNDNSSNHNHVGGGDIPNSGKLFGTDASNYLFETTDHKVVGSLRSQLSNKLLNNLRVQYVNTLRANAPKNADVEQETRVYVGGSGGAVTFGQNTWVPEVVQSNSIQIVDDLIIDTDDVTYTVGMNHQIYNQSERLPHFTAPVVVYNDVEALENGTPSLYTQLVSGQVDLTQPAEYGIAELGFYAEAEFDLADNIQTEVGLRWDGFTFTGDKPALNETLLNSDLTYNGRALDNSALFSDMNNFQPRMQMTWDINGDGINILKFGTGIFVGPITTQVATLSFYNNGFTNQRITYNDEEIMDALGTGHFVDKETWLSANPPTGGGAISDILMIDPEFQLPTTWKASVSYNRFLTDRIKVGLSGFYNRTWNDNLYVNANLTPVSNNPADNREVYGPASDAVGNVRLFTNADWTSRYVAATLDIQAQLGKDGLVNVSYTKSQGLGGTVYNSGGSNEGVEFVASSSISRFRDLNNAIQNGSGDKFIATLASPTFQGFNFGFNVITAQQRRFTVVASGDPNGTNDTDVAYVPNINSPDADPALAAQYNSLLSSVAPEVRTILDNYQGQISGINAGKQPWIYQTSASISKRFEIMEKYGAALRLDLFNVLNLINYRAGYYNQITTNSGEGLEQLLPLFNWTGDGYSVNPGFGQYARQGQPYNIQLGLKIDF